MDDGLLMLFLENDVRERDIMYISKVDRKTVIHLNDQRELETYDSLNSILSSLSEDDFIQVNRGTAVAKRYVANIVDNIYYMTDGRTFEGSQSDLAMHERILEDILEERTPDEKPPSDFIGRFGVMDRLPIPFGVIELFHCDDDQLLDFSVCYSNGPMDAFWDHEEDGIVGKTFNDLFISSDFRWLEAFKDVAINGEARIITDFVRRADKELTIYCYQPWVGYCACLIVGL